MYRITVSCVFWMFQQMLSEVLISIFGPVCIVRLVFLCLQGFWCCPGIPLASLMTTGNLLRIWYQLYWMLHIDTISRYKGISTFCVCEEVQS